MQRQVYEHSTRSLGVFNWRRSQTLRVLLNEKITGLTHLNPKHHRDLMLKMVLWEKCIIFCVADFVYFYYYIFFIIFFIMFRYYLLSYLAFLLFIFVAFYVLYTTSILCYLESVCLVLRSWKFCFGYFLTHYSFNFKYLGKI